MDRVKAEAVVGARVMAIRVLMDTWFAETHVCVSLCWAKQKIQPCAHRNPSLEWRSDGNRGL